MSGMTSRNRWTLDWALKNQNVWGINKRGKTRNSGAWKWYEESHRNRKDCSEHWEHEVILWSGRKVFLKRSKMAGKSQKVVFVISVDTIAKETLKSLIGNREELKILRVSWLECPRRMRMNPCHHSVPQVRICQDLARPWWTLPPQTCARLVCTTIGMCPGDPPPHRSVEEIGVQKGFRTAQVYAADEISGLWILITELKLFPHNLL